MLELTKKDIEIYCENLKRRKKSFSILSKRGDRYILINGRKVAKLERRNSIDFLDKEESKEVLNLFASVKKSINSHLVKNEFRIPVIEKQYNSVHTNRKLFDELPVGSQFYYVDVKHCYWRIAYLMGYLSKYYYEKILEKPDLKLYRNMALSCIIAPKEVEYFIDGKNQIKIIENTDLYNRIYENIRYFAWNLFGRMCFETIGEDNCIGYFTDGIMVFRDDLPKVKTTLARHKLQYRIIDCEKTAHREYIYIDDGDIRKI